jgi:sugar phosphate isomerase/epimerase
MLLFLCPTNDPMELDAPSAKSRRLETMSAIAPVTISIAMVYLLCCFNVSIAWADSSRKTNRPPVAQIWAHDNLVAWCAAYPWDAKARSPEERARMLKRLGFKYFAYNWRPETIPTFDTEVDALKRQNIHLLAWALYESDNPSTRLILETFKRHNIHPQLWLMQERKRHTPPNPSNAQSAQEEFPKTPQEQKQWVTEEADRIKDLAELAAPYGSTVHLYNHNGWFGMVENQLAIINRLKEIGITNVGIVYNFSHARDELHDDSKHFPELWKKMKAHVVAVNITGMRWEGQHVYPSQGDSELEMMRAIQESGWKGHVGVIAEKGGDAEVTLRNYLIGLDWLAAELNRPGSSGPRPFPQEP